MDTGILQRQTKIVDYVGPSFVRAVEDVHTARAHIEALGGQVPVIAKIETQAALDHFDTIADAADGIMIARGDLSLETPFTRVPVVQKQLIAKANQRAKPVITAIQMLYSMVSSSHPTRAEVADVTHAILDGSDAVMLSEETAVGEHPMRAVEVMAAIARETEAGVLPDTLVPGAMEPPPTGEEAVVPGRVSARYPGQENCCWRRGRRVNVSQRSTIRRADRSNPAARYRRETR